MDATTQAFIDTLTSEDEALAAINALRARFDLAGTEFCTADVTEAVREALREADPALAEAVTSDITERVKGTYYWRKLRDIMAERGSVTIADAVAEACRPLTDGEEVTAQLLVTHGQAHVVAIEGLGFHDAEVAYTWASGHLGAQVATVLDSRPEDCDLHVPTSSLTHGTIDGIALVAGTTSGDEQARFVAAPAGVVA